MAVFLSDLSVVVKPRRKFAVLADEPDNRILECAVTGRANAPATGFPKGIPACGHNRPKRVLRASPRYSAIIVTGDKALLELKNFRKVKLLSLRAYLEEVL